MAGAWDGDPGKAPRISPEEDPRQDAFGRLLVQSFEDLVGDDEGAEPTEQRMSRDVVRGFIALVHDAVGDDMLRDYQGLCHEILARVSHSRRIPRWDAFYDDEVSREIRESALIRLAVHLHAHGADVATFAEQVSNKVELGRLKNEH